MSSVYLPRPLMKRKSSRRLTDAPIPSIVILSSPRLFRGLHGALPAHCGGSQLNGLNNVVVACAAADVAFEPAADFRLGGIGVFAQKVGGGHDHARGAEPALKGMSLSKCGLHRMQIYARRETFDRG